MESLQTVLPREVRHRKFSVDDSELSSWRRSGRCERRHYYSDIYSNNHYTMRPLPELESLSVGHSTVLCQPVFRRVPKCTRQQSIPLCLNEKKHTFRRSASGSQLSTDGSVYAGARFSEAPSPKLLPLPPRHWLDGINAPCPAVCGEMTRHLKSVLQVK